MQMNAMRTVKPDPWRTRDGNELWGEGHREVLKETHRAVVAGWVLCVNCVLTTEASIPFAGDFTPGHGANIVAQLGACL